MRVPFGSFDEYGCWFPNTKLKMPIVDQFIHNAKSGINMNTCKTVSGVVKEMKLVFLLGCARDMNPQSAYYRFLLAKAKIKQQRYF